MPLVRVLSSTALAIHDKTALNANAIICAEETSCLGPIKDKPPTKATRDNSSETFEDENPGPTVLAAESIHLFNSGSEQATKGAGECSSRKEDGRADTDL